jgi:hypothetical protein
VAARIGFGRREAVLVLSWCDKLASTPGAGLKLDYHFVSADALINALSPVLDRMVEGDKPKFTMNNL